VAIDHQKASGLSDSTIPPVAVPTDYSLDVACIGRQLRLNPHPSQNGFLF
jgi:hypothetical protein